MIPEARCFDNVHAEDVKLNSSECLSETESDSHESMPGLIDSEVCDWRRKFPEHSDSETEEEFWPQQSATKGSVETVPKDAASLKKRPWNKYVRDEKAPDRGALSKTVANAWHMPAHMLVHDRCM